RDQATINYLTASLPNPFNGIPQFAGTNLSGSVVARTALMAPYPQFSGISYYTYDGKSWYDALNVKLEKRFSHGYLAALTYTWSSFLSANTLLNAGDAMPSKFRSPQDFPHHIAFSGIYELPIGRGRPLLSGLKSVPQAVLGGWDLSYIYPYQSGPPITFSNVLLTGSARDIPLSSSQRSASQWFNVSVFNRNSAQQLANNLITLSPGFARIRAAAYNSSDASLMKHVQIREGLRVEFRVDALNVFNQVAFSAPNTTPTSSSFGVVTAQMNVPRRLQGMIRLQF